MKKIFTIVLLACSMGFTKANPIAPPPVISEFYLVDGSHWYLELVFSKNFPFNLSTFDGCKIITSVGTFNLKNGIHVTPDSIIVITQDSLQSPLQINRIGDFIIIKNANGSLIDQMHFGTISGSQISAPKQGQSIVNYAFHCWTSSQTIEYHKVKDNHPTIGFNAFTPYNISASSTTGAFTGFVYDKAHNPVPRIHIGNRFYNATSLTCGMFFVSALSGADGSFTIPERSGKYLVQLFYDPLRILSDSILNIEPDSINYFEFTIDTLLTSMNPRDIKKGINLSCFPNPSTGETTISFGIPADGHYASALIKIYNLNGEMARILPVSIGNFQNKYSVKWDGLCYDNSTASGLYFCNLELGGRKISSTKIIIEK